MQNRTDVVGISFWDRFRQTAKTYIGVFEFVGNLLVGFLSANSQIFGELAPFGVAFTAASKPKYTLGAALGSILGYIFSANAAGNMKYIAAVIVVLVIRWLLKSGTLFQTSVIAAPVLTAISLGTSSVIFLVLLNADVYSLILSVSEALLAAGATYFFARSIHAVSLGLENMQRYDKSCLIITFAIMIIAMTGFYIGSLSLGRMLAVLVILLCARYGGEAAGAIAGISAGAAMGIMGGEYGYLMGVYGFGGLLSGVFSPMGSIASAVAFIAVNAFAGVATGVDAAVYTTIYETFAATVVFMCIPSSLMGKFGQPSATLSDTTDTATFKSVLLKKLGFVSEALRDISMTTQKVSARLSDMATADISIVYQATADKVCKRCGTKSRCWQLEYTDLMNSMNDCMSTLRSSGQLTKENIPRYLQNKCCKLEALTNMLQKEYADFVTREGAQRKVSQVRSVVTDQFEGMAVLLDKLSGELESITAQDKKSGAKVKEYFESLGTMPESVTCYISGMSNMTVEVVMPSFKGKRVPIEESAVIVSELCGRDFDVPQLIQREKTCTVVYAEKATFTVKWGAAQVSAGDSRLCGDSYQYICDTKGHANIILSDGMGSGGNAAIDSAMASGLIQRLLGAGVDFDAALKLVNSALLLKSDEESLATLDIASVDLYTGQVDFYKAGAAPTFVRKSGKGGYVESTSLPAGILRGVDFETSSISLKKGDILVMVSDGAVCSGVDWIISDMEHWDNDDMEALSTKILETAKARRIDGREDDITVISAMVGKGA